MFQDALTSLEKEAKENVYAVLDPHIQYEITINKQGEPPKYLSLSKPLTHQRTHAFNPQNIHSNINQDIANNNNYYSENRFTTFKPNETTDVRKSNKSNDKRRDIEKRNICKTNQDVEYIRDPMFETVADNGHNQNKVQQEQHYFNNPQRQSKNYSRMYEKNSSVNHEQFPRGSGIRKSTDKSPDYKRRSNRSLKFTDNLSSPKNVLNPSNNKTEINVEDDKPRPGKVREIASKFNRKNSQIYKQAFIKPQNRPKPLQSYGNQAYLDHVFPDAVEI